MLAGMEKLYVPLSRQALEALHRLADRELRHQRDQAAYLILEGLTRSKRSAPPRAQGDDASGEARS